MPEPRAAHDAHPSDATLLRRATCRGTRLLVAWSGGADSTYLLERLSAARRAGAPLGLTAAHVQHGLRGAAAEADLQHCVARAQELGVPLEIARLEPPRGAGETWARAARYAALRGIAARCDAETLLTAQHLDDQVETILWQLLRGARPSRARGMRRVRALAPGLALVRPLLDLERGSLRVWLDARGLVYREDETNAIAAQSPRNALRLRVIPALDELAPRGWKQRWARFFTREAAAAQRGEGAVERALLGILLQGAGLTPTTARQDELRRALRSGAAGALLGTRFGVRIERAGAEICVRGPAGAPSTFALPLRLPGVAFGPAGALHLRELDGGAARGAPPSASRALLVAARGAALRWRNAAPHERIWPLGMAEPRRLKGLLLGRGLDAAARAATSVLEIDGRVAWVVGIEVDRRSAWRPERELAEGEAILEARYEPARSDP